MTQEHYNDILRSELAQRIFDIDPWNARNEDATPELIADSIKADPLPVIQYLVELVEELQA